MGRVGPGQKLSKLCPFSSPAQEFFPNPIHWPKSLIDTKPIRKTHVPLCPKNTVPSQDCSSTGQGCGYVRESRMFEPPVQPQKNKGRRRRKYSVLHWALSISYWAKNPGPGTARRPKKSPDPVQYSPSSGHEWSGQAHKQQYLGANAAAVQVSPLFGPRYALTTNSRSLLDLTHCPYKILKLLSHVWQPFTLSKSLDFHQKNKNRMFGSIYIQFWGRFISRRVKKKAQHFLH